MGDSGYAPEAFLPLCPRPGKLLASPAPSSTPLLSDQPQFPLRAAPGGASPHALIQVPGHSLQTEQQLRLDHWGPFLAGAGEPRLGVSHCPADKLRVTSRRLCCIHGGNCRPGDQLSQPKARPAGLEALRRGGDGEEVGEPSLFPDGEKIVSQWEPVRWGVGCKNSR